MKTNLEEYMRTKDIKYIEFLNENIEELLRLKQTTNKYYDKAINYQNPIPSYPSYSQKPKHNMNNMTSYISDETKILVLYIIKDLELEDIKKIIWEKIFDFEDELLSTNWIEDELENIDFYGRNYYSDSYYSDGYYTD